MLEIGAHAGQSLSLLGDRKDFNLFIQGDTSEKLLRRDISEDGEQTSVYTS